jgi:hypothetical protein
VQAIVIVLAPSQVEKAMRPVAQRQISFSETVANLECKMLKAGGMRNAVRKCFPGHLSETHIGYQ